MSTTVATSTLSSTDGIYFAFPSYFLGLVLCCFHGTSEQLGLLQWAYSISTSIIWSQICSILFSSNVQFSACHISQVMNWSTVLDSSWCICRNMCLPYGVAHAKSFLINICTMQREIWFQESNRLLKYDKGIKFQRSKSRNTTGDWFGSASLRELLKKQLPTGIMRIETLQSQPTILIDMVAGTQSFSSTLLLYWMKIDNKSGWNVGMDCIVGKMLPKIAQRVLWLILLVAFLLFGTVQFLYIRINIFVRPNMQQTMFFIWDRNIW